MAINVHDSTHRSLLMKALRKSFTDAAPNRVIRKNLLDIYSDKCNPAFEATATDSDELGTMLNLFQKFVRGHLLTLAYYAPKWAVDARTIDGRGLDKRMQAFLRRYSEVLGFNQIQKQLALDSAFGWAVCKIDNGIAPKGISAPFAPRMYRINPDMLIVDPQAANVDECSYIGDIYLVPLNEAQAHEGFDPERAAKLTEYKLNTAAAAFAPDTANSTDTYAEPMTRLLDVYIPKAGTIYTFPCPNDEFTFVGVEDGVLGERESIINPYTLLNLTLMPGYLVELSRLRSLRGLHLLSNEMLAKAIKQARDSQRNPVAPPGSEQDLENVLATGDGDPLYLEDQSKLGLYTIPGPDASILNLAYNSAKMFSSEAGNLEVALGASAGADTARQTEALLGQISASQSLDRRAFEEFLAQIGQKLMALAFSNEQLELETIERVPGTKIEFSRLWAGPTKMPRTTTLDRFSFDVVPFSTSFRTPQERLKQLSQASDLVMKFMQMKGMGMPIAIEAVMKSIGESFDLLPELQEWWNGQEPTPMEQTSNVYQSMAKDAQGSDVRYQGADKGGGEQEAAPAPAAAGGMA